jgi:hypothetical protein
MRIGFFWGMAATALVVSVALGALTGQWPLSFGIGFGIVVGGVLAAVFALALVLMPTAMHEMGHVLAARAVGFDVYGVDIGPAKFRRIADRWRITFETNFVAGGLAQVATTHPRDLVRRYQTILVAGPLGSLLALALFGVPAAWWWFETDHSAGFLGFSAFLAGLALLELSASLRPSAKTASGIPSDMAQILQCRRDPQSIRTGILLHGVLTPWTVGGKRARDWPIELLDAPDTSGAALRPVCDLLRYYHYLDRGDEEQALAFIERAAAEVPPDSSSAAGIHAEHAFALACFRGDVPAAEAALAQSGDQTEIEAVRVRARIAIAAARGDRETVHRLRDAALAGLAESLHLPHIQAEADFLRLAASG